MKTHRLLSLSTCLATTAIWLGGAAALDGPLSDARLDKKIGAAQERLMALQAKAGKSIPAPVLKEARGIVLMRNLKIGLGIGAEAGGGVALVKEPGTNNWRPPVFVRAAEASWGAQIGAQDTDTFIVLMSEKSLRFLKPLGSTGAGAEIEAIAGPVDVGTEFDTDTLKSDVLVYSDAAGAFAGATLKAGGIIGAPLRNKSYHGASMQDVLFGGKGTMTPEAKDLIATIQRFSGAEKKAAADASR